MPIADPAGAIDLDVQGDGPPVVLVPGSCSTGAAWRPVIAAWGGRFRAATTSLPGYGGTAERRPPGDPGIDHLASAVETVVNAVAGAAGEPAHLVGHSFGGLVSLAVALRARVRLASLTILEAPAVEMLRLTGDAEGHAAMRAMAAGYRTAHAAGEPAAVARMIDFYGGPGTFAAWPDRVRDYAVRTTPVNLVDWDTAFGFAPAAAALAALALPLLVVHGGDSHPAVCRANAAVADAVPGARLAAIPGARHFMIATHAAAVADLVARHVECPAAG